MGSLCNSAAPRHRRARTTRGRGESGASAVEAALVLCFVVLPIVFGILSYGYMLTFRQTLSQAATEAARAAAVKAVADTDPTARQDAQKAAAVAAVDNALSTFSSPMSCGTGNLTCTITFEECLEVSPTGCVKVQVTYPYRDHSLLPTVPGLGFTLPKNVGYTAVAGVS